MSLLPEQSLIFSSMLYLNCTRDRARLGDYYAMIQHQIYVLRGYLTTNYQTVAPLANSEYKPHNLNIN
ncbi:hypothetical protein ACJ67_11985 [Methylophilus sp. TWE2]|nr:hypothetical protein ACJ67_11985 [Methylophilus sp. TWE2]